MQDRIATYAADPLAFIGDTIVASAKGPARLRDIWAPYQQEWFAAIAPTLLALARGERPPINRFFVERTKGGSKDSDVALCLLWLLMFSPRPLEMQIGAGDRDQGDEPRKIVKDVLRLNPWQRGRIEVQNWRVVCEATGSVIDILAADTTGSHGARPDVVFLNELSHIRDDKEDFALTLLDNASKKADFGLVIVATNAGTINGWQFKFREMARTSDRWHYSALDRPAPWLPQAEIDEAKVRNSSSRYLRLYWGQWTSGIGDALDPDDVRACVNASAGPMSAEPGFAYVAGLDLGIKHDHSALVCIAISAAEQRVKLVSCESWAPIGGRDVDIAEVGLACRQAAWEFPGLVIGYDPHQAEFLAQQLRRDGVRMEAVPFTGTNCDKMAGSLLQVFRNRQIELYPHAGLIDALGRLSIVEKSYGYKLEAPRDKSGHADLAVALSIACSGITPTFQSYQEPISDGMSEYFAALMQPVSTQYENRNR